ncbi:MAG: zinc ribbon domain-containing protein [Lachnospiraceae bacterium]|nr:zinc ribbon domain-containing protein [Lachnospiraceae bacterium]
MQFIPYVRKIVCGICGTKFVRKTCAKGKTYETVKWSCGFKDRRGKAECASNDIKDDVIERLLIEAYNECVDAKFSCSDAATEENRLKVLLAAEREMRGLYAKGYLSDERYKTESERLLMKIREQEQLIKKLRTQSISADRHKKSATLTQEIADFLISAKVMDWKVTFEFANGYITTKSYTNGRSGNVNGKLCKHKT